MQIYKEPSVRFAGRGEFLFKEQEEHRYQSLSRTGRSNREVNDHAKSDIHIQSCEAEVAAALAHKRDRLFSISNKLVTKRS